MRCERFFYDVSDIIGRCPSTTPIPIHHDLVEESYARLCFLLKYTLINTFFAHVLQRYLCFSLKNITVTHKKYLWIVKKKKQTIKRTIFIFPTNSYPPNSPIYPLSSFYPICSHPLIFIHIHIFFFLIYFFLSVIPHRY